MRPTAHIIGTRGEWKLTSGDFYGDKAEAMGLQTSQDARFYGITSKFDTPFTNEQSGDLVVQFQVKHPQKLDCGGGYIKLLPSSVNQQSFSGDSPYYIMFGPDVCILRALAQRNRSTVRCTNVLRMLC